MICELCDKIIYMKNILKNVKDFIILEILALCGSPCLVYNKQEVRIHVIVALHRNWFILNSLLGRRMN